MKAARTLGILTVQLIIAWMPLLIISFIKIIGGPNSDTYSRPSSISLLFGMINSAFNPIAYGMTNREFRKYAVNAFGKSKKKIRQDFSSGLEKSGETLNF